MLAKGLLEFETLSGDEIKDLLLGKRPTRESVIEPQTPRSSAVPPAGKSRPRPDPEHRPDGAAAAGVIASVLHIADAVIARIAGDPVFMRHVRAMLSGWPAIAAGHDGGVVHAAAKPRRSVRRIVRDARSRGLFMGNRGGRIHTDDRKLTKRRWASRQWICCVLDFKNRQRDVWGRYYTELFFLDEVTALAAGHRPCFECRRKDAEAFAERWQRAFRLPTRPRADEMDLVLHAERLDGRAKRLHRRKIDDLPDGAMIALEGEGAFAVRGNALLRWTPGATTREAPAARHMVDVLTPPAILSVLAAGYRPQWHPSADKLTSSPP